LISTSQSDIGVERGVVNCNGPNKSFDYTRSEEERNSAVFDVDCHVLGFGEATKEKRKSFNRSFIEETSVIARESSSCKFYMRNKRRRRRRSRTKLLGGGKNHHHHHHHPSSNIIS
jgi:hypothetical protein